MSNKVGVCMKCGFETRLTRGYCATSCYSRLLRNGTLHKIENKKLPDSLNDLQKEILIGSLLGDGCLYTPDNDRYSPIFSISRTHTDIEYLKYQFSFFQNFCSTNITLYEVNDERTQKIYKGCRFASRRCPAFSPFRKKWYPQNSKIIPKDLELTPTICAIWFCDDGCIFTNKKNRLHLKLSTHGFPNEDTIWLAKYLSLMLNEHFSVGYDRNHAFIIGADAASKSFIKYIENYIPISMTRKITWPKECFSIKRSRPHIKNRMESDLNDKEFLILSSLQNDVKKSSLEICKEIGWIGLDGRPPSSYNRYLKRFLSENWINSIKIVLNGKSNTKYLISENGKKILNKLISSKNICKDDETLFEKLA